MSVAWRLIAGFVACAGAAPLAMDKNLNMSVKSLNVVDAVRVNGRGKDRVI